MFAAAESSELSKVKIQLAECKSELAEILQLKDSLEIAVQHLKIALDESKQEKAQIEDSKRMLSIELEDVKKQLRKKRGQIEELQDKFENAPQHTAEGRTLWYSSPAWNQASEGAVAMPKSEEQGSVQFLKQLFSSSNPPSNDVCQGASGIPKSKAQGTVHFLNHIQLENRTQLATIFSYLLSCSIFLCFSSIATVAKSLNNLTCDVSRIAGKSRTDLWTPYLPSIITQKYFPVR